MRNLLIILCLVCFMTPAFATMFTPVTMKNQIKESDGIVIGEVLGQESVEDGEQINSKVRVKLRNWHNIGHQNHEVEIYYPGGTVAQRTVKVEGTPTFKVGEEIMLFTKTINDKQWVQNLGLGKFSIQKVGSSKVLINQIFPNHPLVGQITLTKFFKLAEKVKKKPLSKRWLQIHEVEKDNKVVGKELKNTRAISSIEEVEKEEKHVQNATRLLLLMAGILIVYMFFRKRNS